MARKQQEVRWVVYKDYRKDNFEGSLTDTWPILYGTEAEATAAKTRLESGQDKSWFDPAGNEYAGYEAFLYVDQIELEG
jgi:hypothetical protein